MRRIIATLAALATVASLLPAAFVHHPPQADAACITRRDGSVYCDPTPTSPTPTPPTPDGTRPPQLTATPSPTPTNVRETATPTATGTPCVVVLRDGTVLACGATATPAP